MAGKAERGGRWACAGRAVRDDARHAGCTACNEPLRCVPADEEAAEKNTLAVQILQGFRVEKAWGSSACPSRRPPCPRAFPHPCPANRPATTQVKPAHLVQVAALPLPPRVLPALERPASGGGGATRAGRTRARVYVAAPPCHEGARGEHVARLASILRACRHAARSAGGSARSAKRSLYEEKLVAHHM